MVKKLRHMRKYYFETIPACPGHGYVVSTDGFDATFLQGRNVVIVEAAGLGNNNINVKAVLQTAEWNKLAAEWEKLDQAISSAESDEQARAEGVDALQFVEDFLMANKISYTVG